MIVRRFLIAVGILLIITTVKGQELSYVEKKDIGYTDAKDGYRTEKCLLDLYYPKDKKDFVTVIWFHGGGLTGGDRSIPDDLKGKGIAVVSAGYRFSPYARVTDIIDDAAEAVKWVSTHIADYGGSQHKIVISGHSAGAYLALMLGLNKQYLLAKGVDVDKMLGIVSLSAQTITHFTARKEQGLSEYQPVIDSLAPLFWVRKDALPITLITGDRELEMLGRYEENAYLNRMLLLVGHPKTKLLELQGYGHSMTYPAFPLLLRQITEWAK